jgi:serine O-acetyltransferase
VNLPAQGLLPPINEPPADHGESNGVRADLSLSIYLTIINAARPDSTGIHQSTNALKECSNQTKQGIICSRILISINHGKPGNARSYLAKGERWLRISVVTHQSGKTLTTLYLTALFSDKFSPALNLTDNDLNGCSQAIWIAIKMNHPKITFKESMRRFSTDRRRLLTIMSERQLLTGPLIWPPGLTSVLLYRMSRFCYERQWGVAARLFWQLNLFLTGADISPISNIGEGFVIIHPVAVTVAGSAGRNFTVEGWGGLGGGISLEDIGAGPGLPLLGDNTTLHRGAMVLGAVTLGTNVVVGPGCTVTQCLPSDTQTRPQKFRSRRLQETAPEKSTTAT